MGNWELRVLRVIEGCTGPGGGVVAVLARSGEELRLRRMTGVRGVVVIGLVTSDTGRGQCGVVAVNVAIGALPRRDRVRSSQRERCVVVVEGRVCPDGGVVAQFAGCWEAGGGVRRAGGASVILLMARVTESAIQCVIVVDVTIGAEARRHGVRPGQLEAGAGVIECAIGPQDCVVAAFAGRRESRGDVIHRRSRVVVIRLVTRYAGRARQVVIVVDVAIGAEARRHGMGAGQREAGAGVVEGGVRPKSRVVARIARLREIGADVVWAGGSLIILQVAGHARCAVQVVVVIDVAIRADARRHGVRTGERKSGVVVIERSVQPTGGVVTGLAGLREIRADVVRSRRSLEILEVAGDASRAVQAVVVIDVAIGASPRWHGVRARERESRRGVIERCIQPTCGVVAGIASLREIRADVVRARGRLKVLQVARDAGRAGQVVIVVDVAIGAGARRHGVHAGQRKPRGGVIESRIGPRGCVVALLASRRESGVRYRRRRVVVIGLVAADARGIRDVVVVVDVAIAAGARWNCVRSSQRETRR